MIASNAFSSTCQLWRELVWANQALGRCRGPLVIIRSLCALLAPTVLSLMGVDKVPPLPGRDLTRTLPEFGNSAGPPPRAMMQYEQSYARLQGDILTVLLPNGTVNDFSVNGAGQRLTPIVLDDQERHRDALASALMPAWIYRERRYRVEYPQ